MCQREDAGRLTLYEDSLLPLGKLYSLETAFEKAQMCIRDRAKGVPLEAGQVYFNIPKG